MTKTMELTINETLFEQIQQAARSTGLSISDFVQGILDEYLRQHMIVEMERQEIEAYLRQPVTPEESEIWMNEQVWSEL